MPSRVSVELPGPLRRFAGGRAEVAVEGSRVSEAIADLCHACPELGRRLLDAEGAPRGYVRLYLNGDDLGRHAGLDTPVEDGDRLTLVVAVAGG